MIFFFILITLFYCLLIGALIFGWTKLPEYTLKNNKAKITFSIVVPYRNEAENLPPLLKSFEALHYPRSKYEILLINDGSTDSSENICRNFKTAHPELKITLLENTAITKSPKKEALLTGIKSSQFEYILTTDADCTVSPQWLSVFNDRVLGTGAKLVAGPVTFLKNSAEEKLLKSRRYFHAFQELDFLSLQASGGGGFGLNKAFICNGANLCYEKTAFHHVDGFRGNEHISSGDDVFLLQKFIESKFPVNYLKTIEAVVYTKPQQTLNELISQRIRWAAKTSAYQSLFAKILGITVLLMNFSLLLCAFLITFYELPYQVFLLIFLLKFNVDFVLIYKAAKFFDKAEILRNYFWSSLLYPVFSVYIALTSVVKGFEWKGRRFGR